jgi:PadR family transcriptional regulator PadR
MVPLELLILKTLSRGPNHGFGITLHIEDATGGLLSVEEGSLYPALHRLEREGLLDSEWGVTENSRRAKFYSLTATGSLRLRKVEETWQHTSKAVARLLRYA